ncbi:MAG: DsbC family protein [Legionellales bacterium]|jgi:thiol:disulfide interchange protein DsbC
MLKRTFTLTSFILLSFAAQANTPSVETMQNQLVKAIPEINVDSVKPAPIAGFYEVTSGPAILYVSQNGQYIFYGELLEVKDHQVTSLTDNTRKAYVKTALEKIDPKTFIKFPATGKEKAVVYMGTDVDCGYCGKLHQEIPALNAAGITVNYIAFPRTPKGTPSYEKSVGIWCAKDPKKTIDDVFKGGAVPEKSADCKDPFASHTAFISNIGASATPVIILQDGTVIPGYMPADSLIAMVLKSQ